MSMKKNWLNMYKKRKASYDGNDVTPRSNNLSLPNNRTTPALNPLTEVSSTPSIPVSDHTKLPPDTWTSLVSCHPVLARSQEHQSLYDELRKTCYLIETANVPIDTNQNSESFVQDLPSCSSDAKPAFQLTYRAMLARKGYLARNTLGSGSYSKVKKVLNCNDYPITVSAVKIIDRLKTPKDYQEKFMPRELEIWPQLKHPNLVALISHFCDVRRVFMVLEYVSGGDALQFIQKNGAVGECVAQRWGMQIIDAVQYLHNANITHRDLKLENILLTEDKQIKICDFGFIKRQVDIGDLSKTYCGSRSYAAPEILMGRPYDPKKTDIWAIGVILYIFVFGNMPFDETKGTKSMLREQESMDARWVKYKNRISPHCQNLLVKTFTWDFDKRPDIHFLHRSAWLSSIICTTATPCSNHKSTKSQTATASVRMGSDSKPCRTLSPLLAAAAAVLADQKVLCEERCCEGVRTMLDGLKPSRSKSQTNLLSEVKSSSEGKKSTAGQRARSRYRTSGSSRPGN